MSDLLRIGLPLPIDVLTVLHAAINERWPDAVVLTEHEYGPDTLVIRLEGDGDG